MVDSKRERRLKVIESRIQPVQVGETLIHMMIWGRVKSGKTATACTAPKPIMLMAERGAMTVRKVPDLKTYPVHKSGKYKPLRWDDTYDFLYYLRYADHDRKSVVVDTMSALVRTGIRYINRDEEARDDARAPGVTDKRTWGRLGTLITEFMEELETICVERSMHLIYTAQERQLRDEDVERLGVDVVPDFTPQIRSFITEKPSILARTFIEEEDAENVDEESDKLSYGMIFRDPDLLVGERVTPLGAEKPWLPRKAYNVTIPKIIKRIDRSRKEEE